MLARITIVGRPNVGKSSLFNALAGIRIAIVSDIENTTRDILEHKVRDEELGVSYVLADSGGLAFGTDDEILKDVRKRVEESMDHSDLVIFILEYDKITSFDQEIAKLLRRSGKYVIVVANKADNPEREREAYEIMSLGFDDFVVTSVAHGRGLFQLNEKIAEFIKAKGFDTDEPVYADETLKMAIIGRPNVGKSSLINAMTGENRVMVRDMPGTTRDAIDTEIEHNGEKIILIDTAGIRRSGKIGTANIEDWSVLRSERAIERSDVEVIVMDAEEGITGQDQAIVGKAIEAKKGIIFVFNKWDKVLARPDTDADDVATRYQRYIANRLDFCDYAEALFTSAIDGKRIDDILDIALAIKKERRKRVKTAVFNEFLAQVTMQHAPTGNRKSHKPKVYYGSQVDIEPPRFVISVNNAKHFHFSYPRYLENRIREHFGFAGTPVEVELKGRESIFKKGGGLKEPDELAAMKAKRDIEKTAESIKQKKAKGKK
ncbi:MAG: GTPase Der [Patescibacteria group bacterium]|nr:GTPase Der [Patescibacteria group bacterium]